MLHVPTRASPFPIFRPQIFLSGYEHSAALISGCPYGEDAARLWEIAENLHRAELTALERAENIAEWIRLADKVGQLDPLSKGGRGNEGGVRAAAREIGVERMEARRAEKVASLSDDAKEAAREAGLGSGPINFF